MNSSNRVAPSTKSAQQVEQVKAMEEREDVSTPSTNEEESNKQQEDTEKKHHVVLLGDSILDNKSYVWNDGPSVIEQLQYKIKDQGLPWKATLCAVDGAIIGGVKRQLKGVAEETTVLVLSIGGNNGLMELGEIQSMGYSVLNPFTAYNVLTTFLADFRKRYADNLDLVINHANSHCSSAPVPLIVCTIYYPQFDQYFSQMVASVGLGWMNSIILDEAKKRGLPVIDLATIFDRPQDYANPIEPGVPGGDKITSNIIKIVKEGLDKGHQIYASKEYSETRVMYAQPKEGGGEKRTEEERFLNALRADEERRERFRDESGRSVEDNEVFRHN